MNFKALFISIAVLCLAVLTWGAEGKSAAASHILVSTEKQALELKKKIVEGAEFSEMARQHSSCPSKARGGALGTFGPGQMVPEFNNAVFDANNKVGEVVGPVKTQFGYHLILVTDRKD